MNMLMGVAGGKVYIFTGMLKICKDDDGIASVLGHEIAHNVSSICLAKSRPHL